jgi:heme/copper-type cytochrome/quinol oxidase subunit 3
MVMRYYPSGTISRNAYPTKRVRKCLWQGMILLVFSGAYLFSLFFWKFFIEDLRRTKQHSTPYRTTTWASLNVCPCLLTHRASNLQVLLTQRILIHRNIKRDKRSWKKKKRMIMWKLLSFLMWCSVVSYILLSPSSLQKIIILLYWS